MWIGVKNKEVILPSMSKIILVTDGQRPQLVTVEKFLETVDTPYNTWTHWMEIPKIEGELIFEEELDKLAIEYENAVYGYSVDLENDLETDCSTQQNIIDIHDTYKAGYRKAKEL